VTRRVLIVHSRVGGGHVSAARALAEALEATGDVQTRLVDAYLDCGRFPLTLFPAAYAELARAHRNLWSAVFNWTNLPGAEPRVAIGPLLRPGVMRVMQEFQPDLVISVLPMINGVLADARTRAVPSARLEVVLTDWHSVHRFWVGRGVDHYTAPTESARQDCVAYGASPDAVAVVGLPVRSAFASITPLSPGEREAVLRGVGLAPERFTVLVMVGAEGSPGSLGNIRALLSRPFDGQVVVVCGRNARLRRKVEALASAVDRRALGFVDNVADLMRASDLLVTKAGGLTLAEAFCCSVAVVVQDVLPGQEEGNLAYALQHGAVEYAPRPEVLVDVVHALRADGARRQAVAERGHALSRPRAAPEISKGMLARL
jgi:UDP-N-acetylglucosamine:LPS N-acetylglucosamine transferase